MIEIDGASNNLVDDVRELREQVKYLPTTSKYKIIIIDEVHMLSHAAFNALLKTLEEPPAHVIFIFATTESHKIPITILSRCQKYDFRKLGTAVLLKHLQNIAKEENIKIDEGALHVLTQCAQGSVRDALSLLDQIDCLASSHITEEHVRNILGLGDRLIIQETFAHLIQENLKPSLDSLNQVDERGLDLKLFTEELLKQFRHLILLESTKHIPSELSPTEAEFFKKLQGQIDLSLLLAQYQVLFRGIQEISHTEFQKTTLEICFVKINQIRNMISLADLVDQIKNRSPSSTKTTAGKQGTEYRAQKTRDEGRRTKDERRASDWYQLVKWITKEKPPLGSLLKDTIPISFSDQKIEIAIAPHSQAKNILIERVPTIKSMLQNHFGKQIEFTIKDLTDEKKKPSV